MTDPGFPINVDAKYMRFSYGPGAFGPKPVYRTLDEIRASLLDPTCTGPDPVYAIAMDTGRTADAPRMRERNLLFGVMVFAAGQLGEEPVRTQGHVHRRSPRNGWSTPELYEIWNGRAIVLMQEHDREDPGRCFAAEAGPGGHIVVPPGWAHATISADPAEPLVFGAWCDRDYGFVYDGVRRHRGLAYFPIWRDGALQWQPNPTYQPSGLIHGHAVDSTRLGVAAATPIYRQFEQDPGRFQWVSEPATMEKYWTEI